MLKDAGPNVVIVNSLQAEILSYSETSKNTAHRTREKYLTTTTTATTVKTIRTTITTTTTILDSTVIFVGLCGRHITHTQSLGPDGL